MKEYVITAGPDRIGIIDPNIYGGFVEHLGRNVYGGVYDPEDPTADENGFRQDVMACIRELDMPVTRYPGGCYTDTWRWEDSVGPRDKRPVRLDPQWRQKEPHLFGLDEFIRWCRLVHTEPVLTLNLSTRGIPEAEDLWEYCNFPGGTTLSDQRIRNGSPEPHNIRYWCLGNEIYGSALGRRSASDYAWLARETARMLKMHDPEAQVILCGFPLDTEWNRAVLTECYPYVDYLSLHRGFDDRNGDYLKTPDVFEKEIDTAFGVCEEVRQKLGLERKMKLSVDEWIIYDHNRRERPGEAWTAGPHLLEQDYTIREALIAGGLLSVFQNHCHQVSLACIAQSINVIAPIRTEKNGVLWKQSLYDVLRYMSQYGRGEALKCAVQGDDDKDLVVSAVRNGPELVFFLTLRSGEPVKIRLNGAGCVTEALTLHSDDVTVFNTPGHEVLRAGKLAGVTQNGPEIQAELPGFSWNMIRIKST